MSKIVVCNNCGHTWRTQAKRPQCNTCKKISVREATDEEKHQYNHPEELALHPEEPQEKPQEKPQDQEDTEPDQGNLKELWDRLGVSKVEESTPESQPFEEGELFQPLPPGEVEEIDPQIILSPELTPKDPQEIPPEPQEKPQGISWTKPLIVVLVGACVVLAGVYYLKGRKTQAQEVPEDPTPETCIGGYTTPGAFC